MLNDLPLDIIQKIFLNLNSVNDLINIIKLNKYLNLYIDDTYFIIWAFNNYNKEFWIKANRRSKCISKPLKSMKLELLRLQKFIDCIKIQNIRWSNEDFYKFWNLLEQNKESKSKTTKNYFYTNLSIQL